LHFAPDTEDTLEFAVDLLNTVASATKSGVDELSTPAELTALLDANGYTGRFDRDDAELVAVRETRALLRRVWSLERGEAVTEVNRMLRDAGALPFLVRHDHFDWHLHATPDDAPLDERIRVEVALALVDVIRTDEMSRMRECEAFDCTGVLLDLSRNASKRFCSVRCGNRMNMVAFRERRAEEAAGDEG
jgi:predicted RNA-binding Zn ribbon-like protein